MVLKTDKCGICCKKIDHSESHLKNMTRFSDFESSAFTAWKSETARATCEVLFGNNIDYFFNYFQNIDYCHVCQQILRDISFTRKQIQSLQNRINDLSNEICNSLQINYQSIEENCGSEVVKNKVSHLFNFQTIPKSRSKISYGQMVEIILSVCPDDKGRKNAKNRRKSPVETSVVNNEEIDNEEEEVLLIECVKIKRVGITSSESESSCSSNDCTENKDSSIGGDSSPEIQSDNFGDTSSESSSTSESSDTDWEYNINKRKVCKTRKDNTISKKWKSNDTTGKVPTGRVSCTEDGCNIYFRKKEIMEAHVLKSHKGVMKPFKCTECKKSFKDKSNLDKHTRIFHNSCKFCGRKYRKQEDLNLHYSNAHQEPNPFQCAFCTEIYSDYNSLKTHTTEIHPDPNSEPECICDFCGKKYFSIHVLKTHLLRVHPKQEELLFKCSICDKNFAIKRLLEEHVDGHNTEAKYNCEVCEKAFYKMEDLKRHRRRNHRTGGYQCNICEEVFSTINTLRSHERLHVQNKNLLEAYKEKLKKQRKVKIPQLYECKFCSKGYNTEEEINEHYEEAHKGPSPFSCAFCSETYNNSLGLQKHTKSVHPDTALLDGMQKCESDKVFGSKKGLQKHSMLHGDTSLLFKCDVCPAVFTVRVALENHSQRHSEGSNFFCEICGKGFAVKSDFSKHFKTHSERERKFQCKLCDKKFYTNKQCGGHEKTHINFKEFVCKVCGKSFSHESILLAHIKIHPDVGNKSQKSKLR